jgi:hypothetical protein
MQKVGWEAPQGREMPGWWHLDENRDEARLGSSLFLVVLPEVYGVPVNEMFRELMVEALVVTPIRWIPSSRRPHGGTAPLPSPGSSVHRR